MLYEIPTEPRHHSWAMYTRRFVQFGSCSSPYRLQILLHRRMLLRRGWYLLQKSGLPCYDLADELHYDPGCISWVVTTYQRPTLTWRFRYQILVAQKALALTIECIYAKFRVLNTRSRPDTYVSNSEFASRFTGIHSSHWARMWTSIWGHQCELYIVLWWPVSQCPLLHVHHLDDCVRFNVWYQSSSLPVWILELCPAVLGFHW